MPVLHPFRALRYDASRVSDLARVLCPPYDIIDPDLHDTLLARDDRNAVRIELPAPVGHADAEAYREAGRTVDRWRSDGTLVLDQEPTVTLHEMTWANVDGSAGTAVGVVARLKLEHFGPTAGVLPHERTMSGPKEDRYQLLSATRLNTSPVVLLAGSEPDVAGAMSRLTAVAPDAQAVTDDGVRHRLWVLPASESVERLLGGLAARRLTIADGHHRYETALRYREERGGAEPDRRPERGLDGQPAHDPAWDYVLALVYPDQLAPPVLPTHRVVLDGLSGTDLLASLDRYFEVERLASRSDLLVRMAVAPALPGGATGSGRVGLASGGIWAILRSRPKAIEELLDPSLSAASRGLDVNALAAVLEAIMGVDPPALAAGGRLVYVKDAGQALGMVEGGEATCAFLLDPPPVTAVARVAAAGEVMPQKSTYFHPKAPTGLLFGPLEW